MKRRVDKKNGADTYKGLDIMSQDQFLYWAITNQQFITCYDMWVKHDYHKHFAPSVHRKNPLKGYVKGNMEFMPLKMHLIKDTPRTPIAGIDPKTFQIKYTLPSISSAKEFGFCPATISKTMSDKYPHHITCGGLVWRTLTK